MCYEYDNKSKVLKNIPQQYANLYLHKICIRVNTDSRELEYLLMY